MIYKNIYLPLLAQGWHGRQVLVKFYRTLTVSYRKRLVTYDNYKDLLHNQFFVYINRLLLSKMSYRYF